MVCHCSGSVTEREELDEELETPVAELSRDDFHAALNDPMMAPAIARWVRRQGVIPFYSLANDLEPD